MAGLLPSGLIRIQRRLASPADATVAADGSTVPQAGFVEPDEVPENVAAPAFPLPLASARAPAGLNITATLEAAVSEKASAHSLTFEVDGLREDDVLNMAEGAYIAMEAGYDDAPGSTQAIFFGQLDTRGYTFTSGRDRWKFAVNGKPQDDYTKTVHLAATKGMRRTIGDMLTQASGDANIPVDIPPEAFGELGRIPVLDGYSAPVEDGPTLMNVAADATFRYDGTFEGAIIILVGMLRDAVRRARGVDLAWQYVASPYDLRVIISNFDGDAQFNPQANVDLSSPDVISADLTMTRKQGQAPTDQADATGAAARPAVEKTYEMVLTFDPRIFLGLVINVDGSKVGKRSLSFIVRSYKHMMGGKGGWRTECKGTVIEPDVRTAAIYNLDQTATADGGAV